MLRVNCTYFKPKSTQSKEEPNNKKKHKTRSIHRKKMVDHENVDTTTVNY